MTAALENMVEVARRAAVIAAAKRPAVVETKGIQDYVTDIDRLLEEEIREGLRTTFPGVPVLGEESIPDALELPDRAFVVDPLDGTSNWIAGLPFSSISIAYLEKGETVLAAVAVIGSEIAYRAEIGKGAWRNDIRLRAEAQPSIALMSLSTGLLDAPAGPGAFKALRRFGKLRNFGCQSLHLCAVAHGSFSLTASIEARLWDDAAGKLVAEEAGCRYAAHLNPVDALRPAAAQRSLCAHPAVFDEVSKILAPLLQIEAGD